MKLLIISIQIVSFFLILGCSSKDEPIKRLLYGVGQDYDRQQCQEHVAHDDVGARAVGDVWRGADLEVFFQLYHYAALSFLTIFLARRKYCTSGMWDGQT